VLEGCDQVVRIPMEGQVESLNAAAAGSVILYEALRQRRRDVAPPVTQTPRPVRLGEPDLIDLRPDDGDEDEDQPDDEAELEADLQAEDGAYPDDDAAVGTAPMLNQTPDDEPNETASALAAPKPRKTAAKKTTAAKTASPRSSAEKASTTSTAAKTTAAKKTVATKKAKPAE